MAIMFSLVTAGVIPADGGLLTTGGSNSLVSYMMFVNADP